MVYKSSKALSSGAGTVSQINTGVGLTGGPITTTGTISVADSTPDSLAGYDNTGEFATVTVGSGLDLTAGVLTATGGGGSPGGSDTQVQFNDGGAFGGDAGFTYDKTTDFVTIAGGINLGGSTTAFPSLQWNTTQTVDNLLLATGTTSRSVVLVENGDTGFDFAHAQQTNPTLFIHSANQSTTQWTSLSHDGTNTVLTAGTGDLYLNGASKVIDNIDFGG